MISRILLPFAAALCALLLVPGPGLTQEAVHATDIEDWDVDPNRGPVDFGLTDPVLEGAIDIHLHVDPDAPGTGGLVRAIDIFDAAKIAVSRGMRGFVAKNHQDMGSAAGAYLVRKHVSPSFAIYGRMATNYSTGGINPATLQHFASIKGGWGRIFEMPTRDSVTQMSAANAMSRENLQRVRPWMLMMPEGTPSYIPVSKDGELVPEVKHLIAQMAKVRTADSRGRIVLATGHATNEEHLLLAREGRRHGLNVLLTHPGDIPQAAEAAKLGAYLEITASSLIKTKERFAPGLALIKKIGAEHIIVSSDCGQTTNLYPTDCLVMAARNLRAAGVSERELDLMYKINPAKILDLPPPDTATQQTRRGR